MKKYFTKEALASPINIKFLKVWLVLMVVLWLVYRVLFGYLATTVNKENFIVDVLCNNNNTNCTATGTLKMSWLTLGAYVELDNGTKIKYDLKDIK